MADRSTTLIDCCLNNREALLSFGVNGLIALTLAGSGYVQGITQPINRRGDHSTNQQTSGRTALV